VDAISTTPPALGVAWGIDLAAPAMLVAQRGFAGMVCNEMADLARWHRSDGATVLLAADHVVATLIEREHLSGAPVSVGVAVPGWLGTLERQHFVDRLTDGCDPMVTVTLISSPVCLAIGSSRAAVHPGSASVHEVVLAVDAGIGWSAAVVQVDDHEVRELAGVAVEPGRPVERARLLRALLDAAFANGAFPAIERVVVIGGVEEHELLEGAVAELLGGAEAPRIGVVATRRTTSGGAMALADPAAGLRAGDTIAVDLLDAGAVERTDTLPDDAITAVAVASSAVAVAVAGLVGSPAGVGHGQQRRPASSAGDGSFSVGPLAAADVIGAVEPVDAPRERHSNPGGLAEVLQRCERLLSSEVGARVAVRSVPALLGCSDDASDGELRASAGRLRALGERRGDELGSVLVAAVVESLRCLADDPAHRYMAGTLADVGAAVAQVVEHLRVVVGVVAPAERRRLVRDAALLGPDPSVAADLVDRVLGSAADARHDLLHDGATPDRSGWLPSAVSSRPDDRFVLAGSTHAGSTHAGSIAIRVLLEG